MARARERTADLWASLGLLALVAAVYAPVHDFPFVNFDDALYVAENANVAGGLSWEAAQWAFTTSHAGNWHPLTWLSHMFDVRAFGLDAGAHHLVNVAWHAANTLLLFWLLLRTTGARGASAWAAAVFAVHPLHVESVAWVAERKDVLSAFFGLLCLHASVSYTRDGRPARYALVLITFALALMAKPMLVTLPLVLLLVDHWPLGRTSAIPLRRLLLEKAPLLALSAVSCLLTLWAQQQAGAVKALEALPLARRLANAVIAYATYIRQTLWPTDLAVLYPYPASIPAWRIAGAVLLLALVTLGAARELRRRPYLGVGWFWYLGMLVPVIGLVQVGSQPMADRYMYLPMVGLLVMFAWGLPERVPGRWLRMAGVLTVAACAVLARLQLGHWSDSVNLWRHALAATQDNARARNNLGHALLKAGRVAEALPELQEAVRLKPDFAEARNNLGHALSELERHHEAIAEYQEAVRLLPDYHEARNNLGVALIRTGRAEEAIAAFQEALRIRPGLASVRDNLAAARRIQARALLEQGRLDEAVAVQRELLRAAPGEADDLYDLAVMLYRAGRSAEAVQQFEAALALDPSHTQARQALEALARAQRSR